jgi:hypothetical protein
MWVVNGIGYHWVFFSTINPIAGVFAALFVLQAIALAAAPRLSISLEFEVRRDARSITGLALAVFALVVYPLWGIIAGQSYPAMPVFGIAPCPTTIFTIGLLLLGRWSTIRWLLIIPAIWSAIGGTGAILLDIPQDLALLASLLTILAFGIAHWRSAEFAQRSNRRVSPSKSSADVIAGAAVESR